MSIDLPINDGTATKRAAAAKPKRGKKQRRAAPPPTDDVVAKVATTIALDERTERAVLLSHAGGASDAPRVAPVADLPRARIADTLARSIERRVAVDAAAAASTDPQHATTRDDNNISVGSRVAARATTLLHELRQSESTLAMPRTLTGAGVTSSSAFDATFVTRALMATTAAAVPPPPHLDADTRARMRASTQVSTRAHEERMLRTPRTGTNEPACANLDRCLARHVQCAGAGHDTLMAYFYEHEWSAYERALARGEHASLPAQDRECLLCLRNHALTNVLYARLTNRQAPMVCCVQLRNIVDTVGEYRACDCLMPVAYDARSNRIMPFEGLVDPVVKLDMHAFARHVARDKSHIVFKQLLPRVDAPTTHPEPVVAAGGASAPSAGDEQQQQQQDF